MQEPSVCKTATGERNILCSAASSQSARGALLTSFSAESIVANSILLPYSRQVTRDNSELGARRVGTGRAKDSRSVKRVAEADNRAKVHRNIFRVSSWNSSWFTSTEFRHEDVSVRQEKSRSSPVDFDLTAGKTLSSVVPETTVSSPSNEVSGLPSYDWRKKRDRESI